MAIEEKSFYLSATEYAVEDIYGDDEDVYKSGTMLNCTASNENGKSFPPKISPPPVDFQFSTFTFEELKLSVLYLCTVCSAEMLWKSVEKFFAESECVDTEVHVDSKLIYGNYYQNPENCSFVAEVGHLEDGEQTVLSVRRLGGDAFALTLLFENLKDYLESEDFEFEEDENSEVDSDDDSDMEEDNKMVIIEEEKEDCQIEFEYDPDLLNMMINDFETTYLENKNYTMSIFAYASESEANRNFMLKEKWSKRIKTLICKQLEFGKELGDATLTRNTCVFLNNLLEDMEIDHKTLVCVVKAMSEWCPGKKECGRHIGYLQSSRQVMVEADQIFAKIIENNTFSVEKIEKIINANLTCAERKEIEDFVSDSRVEFKSKFFTQFY